MKKILVLDDEKACLFLYEIYFRNYPDVQVICETSPSAALSTLAREKVDAIVSDIQMDEMTGLQFFAKIKESNLHDGIFAFVTGSPQSAKEAAKLPGVNKVFEKPCSFPEIAGFILEQLEAAKAS